MSEEERRKLIARQRSALYGEGPYVDETGTPHPGMPGPPNGPGSHRGHSPLAYEYGRTPPLHPQAGSQPPLEVGQGPQSAAPNDPTRTNSTSSPQPNVTAQQQQAARTSVSSPGGSPPLGGVPNSKPSQGQVVAPIGTRPSGNAAQGGLKRSTPPVSSSLNQGFSTSDNDNVGSAGGPSSQSNPSSAAPEGRNSAGLSSWGGRSAWGNNGSGQQASVWG